MSRGAVFQKTPVRAVVTWASLAVSIALSNFLSSCAAPGQPTPPHPPVPQAISDLAAHQRGSSVVLEFTLPAKTTRGEKIPVGLSIEVYRSYAAQASDAQNGRLLATIAPSTVAKNEADGRYEFTDDSSALSPSGQILTYTVRTSVANRRESADSNLATVRVYGAPAAPADLHAQITESAIELTWSGTSPAYRVFRCEAVHLSSPAACDIASPPKQVAQSNSANYSDRQFTFDKTYIYSVRGVAQIESDTVESENSAPLVVTPKDVFPPSAPTGLVASQIPATGSEPARVELSWEINPETDLAGYNIYRSEGQESPGQRLNPRLLLAPVFRDITVVAGRTYSYCVTAVDRAGNESSPGAAVAVELRQQ